MEDKLQFQNSIEQAKKVISHARKKTMPIFHSGLSFSKDYKELGTSEFGLRHHIYQNRPFQKDSKGSQFIEPFRPLENELVIQGRLGGSAFASSNLDQLLKNNNIKTLYLMGYALHVCVESTLRAAHDLGYDTYVIINACSAFTAKQQDFFTKRIADHFGKTITTDQFIRYNA